jgi:hypothetical protein
MGEREIVGADDADRLPGDARSIDRNKLLRERVLAVAGRRGIPLVFPLLDIEDLGNIGFSDIWGGFDERLLIASARYETPSVLVGRIRPEDLLQPHRWTWHFAGQRLDWAGEPEEATGILADALAEEFVIDPNQPVDSIQLRISGIDSVLAYGRVQRFMENLRLVDKLMVTKVAADEITYDIELQGGLERLDSALMSSGMLEPVASAGVIDANPYRMNRRPFATDPYRVEELRTLEYLYRSQDD